MNRKTLIILISILFVTLLLGGWFVFRESEKAPESQNLPVVRENTVQDPEEQGIEKENSISFEKCGISGVLRKLRDDGLYDVTGENYKFDVAVCGFLVTKKTAVPFSDGSETQTNAYIRILESSNKEFLQSLRKFYFTDSFVKNDEGDYIDFQIGCLEKTKNGEMDLILDRTGIDEQAKNSLLGSTEKKPVAVVLSFDSDRGGFGCKCCTLVSRVQSF